MSSRSNSGIAHFHQPCCHSTFETDTQTGRLKHGIGNRPVRRAVTFYYIDSVQHVNNIPGDSVVTPQYSSSALSPQSLSPSHRYEVRMQSPLGHWNSLGPHAASYSTQSIYQCVDVFLLELLKPHPHQQHVAATVVHVFDLWQHWTVVSHTLVAQTFDLSPKIVVERMIIRLTCCQKRQVLKQCSSSTVVVNLSKESFDLLILAWTGPYAITGVSLSIWSILDTLLQWLNSYPVIW